MSATREPTQSVLDTDRVETLADGVFAIAMTLLVFEINVPDVANRLTLGDLAALGPKLLSYVISFVVLGIYWIGHHNQFHYIRRADRLFLWINILFLMCVAFIPFSAALLGRYSGQELAVIVYGLNLVIVGAVLYGHWWYATARYRLVDRDLPAEVVRMAKRRILMAPIGYVAAILISLVSIPASIAIYVLVPLLYVMPARFDRHLRQAGPPQKHSAEAQSR